MATRWPVSLLLDVPEPRIALDRLVASADGTYWDLSVSDDTVYVDPVTRTAMLAPLPKTPNWATTFTGSYARLALAAFSVGTPAAWSQYEKRGVGDYYLTSTNGETATTAATYAVNQPMFVSLYVPGNESLHQQTVLLCGWGAMGADGSVWLRFRADGSVAVYKGNSIVGDYSLEGGLAGPSNIKGGAQSQQGKAVELLLLPCRRRELLVIGNSGTGFSHIFTDLDFQDLSNAITPADHFWIKCPTTRSVVQVAPVLFATAGNIYGHLVNLRYAPPGGTVFAFEGAQDRIGPYASTINAAYTLVDASGAAFVPDGLLDQARVKVHLTGDGTACEGVYAADLFSDPTTTATYDGTFDLTTFLQSLSLEVPENGPATVTAAAFNPAKLIAAGLPQAHITGNRPFAVRVGSVDFIRGTLAKPKRKTGHGLADGLADLLTWEGTDREGAWTRRQFVGAFPYDGLLLTDAVADLFKMAAFNPASDLDISTDSFELPYMPGISNGQWQLLPERGDSVGQWLDKMHQDYCATWVRGWMPTLSGYKYRFRNPADLSATPVETLYSSRLDAIAGGGVAPGLAPYRVVRNMEFDKKDPECNQIVVIGREPNTLKYITSQYDDAASQDPTTAPASRPSNWMGETITVQVVDPAITTQAAADRTRDSLRDRLTVERVYANWDCDLLVRSTDDRPLWKGDVVRIYDPLPIDGTSHLPTLTGATHHDYRIVAIPKIEMRWENKTGDGRPSVRDCTYTGLRIA